MKVFIAGPYDGGDTTLNVRNAIVAANALMDVGFEVFIPHLSHFQHLVCPRPREDWLKHDLAWLKSCDIVLRLPGESPGADGEVQRARELGKTVWFELGELLETARKEEK